MTHTDFKYTRVRAVAVATSMYSVTHRYTPDKYTVGRHSLATNTFALEVLRLLYWVQRDTDAHLVTNHTGYTYTHIRSLAVAILGAASHRCTSCHEPHWLHIHTHQKSCGRCIGCSVTQIHILSRTTLATHTHTSEVLRSLYWSRCSTDTHLTNKRFAQHPLATHTHASGLLRSLCWLRYDIHIHTSQTHIWLTH